MMEKSKCNFTTKWKKLTLNYKTWVGHKTVLLTPSEVNHLYISQYK